MLIVSSLGSGFCKRVSFLLPGNSLLCLAFLLSYFPTRLSTETQPRPIVYSPRGGRRARHHHSFESPVPPDLDCSAIAHDLLHFPSLVLLPQTHHRPVRLFLFLSLPNARECAGRKERRCSVSFTNSLGSDGRDTPASHLKTAEPEAEDGKKAQSPCHVVDSGTYFYTCPNKVTNTVRSLWPRINPARGGDDASFVPYLVDPWCTSPLSQGYRKRAGPAAQFHTEAAEERDRKRDTAPFWWFVYPYIRDNITC